MTRSHATYFVKISTYDYNAHLFVCDRHMIALIDEPTITIKESESLARYRLHVEYGCQLCEGERR